MSPVRPGNADPCPSAIDIDRLASGDDPDGRLASHVDVCDVCAARLEAAREDASFLTRARALIDAAPGPEGAPRITGYRLQSVISSGSQGIVYRAIQEATSRVVAIKTLSTGGDVSPRQRHRAEREAEITARLRHPNLVTVFESRTLPDGRIAVVMEHVDGVPLDAWRPPGDTPVARQRALIEVFVAVCNGIHNAHLNGVIHRDLKPDNILVTADGRPVVIDFGIARAGTLRLTMTGEFAGTPAYVSPEQASGKSDQIDALTDVYSLGVILYQLVCRAMPYDVGGSIFEIVRAIESAEPIPPRQMNPAVSPDLEAIMLKAMRKDKILRYQSAASLGRDLERFLAGVPVDARSGSGWYLLRKAIIVNRSRLAWAVGVLLAVIGAGVVVAFSLADAAAASRRAAIARARAHEEEVRAQAITELLREVVPPDDPARPELARELGAGLDRVYIRLETGAFADDPDVDQAIRRLWSRVYTDISGGKAVAQVQYAEVALRTGLERLRAAHGAAHVDIASTLHELAAVLLVRRRYAEADRAVREAIAMREQLLGPDHADVATSRALLARILMAEQRGEQAEREARRALDAIRNAPGRDADTTAAALAALIARARFQVGDAAQAEPLLREALCRRMRALIPAAPDVLDSLREAADLVAVAPSSSLAHDIALAWGVPSDRVADALRADLSLIGTPNFGTALAPAPSGRAAALGRLAALQRLLLGPMDPSVAQVYMLRMRAAEAEGLMEDKIDAALSAAAVLTAVHGPDHRSLLPCYESAALDLATVGEAARAVELARSVLRIRSMTPADARDPLLIGNSHRYLAWFLALDGTYAEAVEEGLIARDLFERALGPDHHILATIDAYMAMTLTELSRTPGAPPSRFADPLAEADARSFRASEAISTSTSMPGDQALIIRMHRAHVLCAMGRYVDASPLIDAGWNPGMEAPTRYPWRRLYFEDAIACAEFAGDAAKAADLRRRMEAKSQAPTSGPP